MVLIKLHTVVVEIYMNNICRNTEMLFVGFQASAVDATIMFNVQLDEFKH